MPCLRQVCKTTLHLKINPCHVISLCTIIFLLDPVNLLHSFCKACISIRVEISVDSGQMALSE